MTMDLWTITKKTAFYALVIFIVVVAVFPFYYAVLTSFKAGTDLFRVNYFPESFSLANYLSVLNSGSFPQNLLNSVFVAAVTVLAALFLAFLQRELIPRVEREFRAGDRRALAGNSRGGLFVVYALTAEPALFHAYIANSPALWRDDAAMVRRLDGFLRSRRDLRATLFLSLGGAENPKMAKAYQQAIAVLQRAAPAGLRWKAYRTPDATHADNAQKATPLALQWTYPVDDRNEAAP